MGGGHAYTEEDWGPRYRGARSAEDMVDTRCGAPSVLVLAGNPLDGVDVGLRRGPRLLRAAQAR